MAVNINTVYTTVLFILNKEQRGYVTPIEFNSISTQVQEEIFASYFPDGNQLNRFNQNNQQNDTEFFNMFKGNAYKLYPFEQDTAFALDIPTQSFYYAGNRTVYKTGEIISTYTGNPTRNSITQLTSKSDFSTITRSRLTSPTSQYPIAHNTHANVTPITSTGTIPLVTNNSATAILAITTGTPGVGNLVTGTGIANGTTVAAFNSVTNLITFSSVQTLAAGVSLVFSSTVIQGSLIVTVAPVPNSLSINCLFRPTNPVWGFDVGTLGQYTYNASTSTDFELDVSEQTNLIINILKYCGIIISDPNIVQQAQAEAQQVENNEKS